MSINEQEIIRNIASAIYWIHDAERDAKAGDFMGASHSLQYASNSMRDAGISDLHRYYQTGETNETVPNLEKILNLAKKQAAERAKEDENE